MKKLNGLFCILALVICFLVIFVGCGSQTEEKIFRVELIVI